MQSDLEKLDSVAADRTEQVSHAENVIASLSAELNQSQDNLHKSQDKIIQLEALIGSYKEKLDQAQNEVSLY